MAKLQTVSLVAALSLCALPAWCQVDKIIFISNRTGNGEIFAMNGNGSEQTNLTNTPSVDEESPSWRPDGGRITYARTNEIWTMKSDGSDQQGIPVGHIPRTPDYDPTGTKISYSAFGGYDHDVYVMTADGSSSVKLVNNQLGDYFARWSPDGSRITYSTFNYFGGNYLPDVYIMNADGSGQTRLTFSGNNANADWSPDGTKLVFESKRDGDSEIYVMNADGSGQTALTDNTFNDGLPVFSPDGSRIAFVSDRSGNEDIYVMNADGSDANNPEQLTTSTASDTAPSWARTGLTGPPRLSINNVTREEGDSGLTNAVFIVSLPAPSSSPVTVDFATSDGTAIAGSDFRSTSGTLTFAPGETEKIITVAIIGDTRDEDNETFQVTLSNAQNTAIGDGVGTGTIVDDDTSPTATISHVTLQEGDSGQHDAVFTVSLSAPASEPSSIDYATTNGTATAGSDYQAVSGTLTFDTGEQTKTISVPVFGDTVDESDETFFMDLSHPQHIVLQTSPNFYTGNGHYYEAVVDPGTWQQAATAAAARTYLGYQGHLATIADAGEQAFLTTLLHGQEAWIGAIQAVGATEPAGGFSWITNEPWSYTNWRTGEPNNANPESGNEDRVIFVGDGRWNDMPQNRPSGRYLVEYDTPPAINVASQRGVATIVNDDALVARDDAVTTDEDIAVDINVLDNDEPAGNIAVREVVIDADTHGAVTIGQNGHLHFVPEANFKGTATFRYQIANTQDETASAKVVVTVTAINDAPVAHHGTFTLQEDAAAITIDLRPLVDDVETGDDALLYQIVAGPTANQGTLTPADTNGQFRFTPAADFNGRTGFTYKVRDTGEPAGNIGNAQESSLKRVVINVTPVNDAPVATDQQVATSGETPLPITLTATDIDSTSLTYAIVTPPAHGTVTVNNPPNNGSSLTYKPAANFAGRDSFTFKANDGSINSNFATVTITVGGSNAAPVARDDSYNVDGSILTIDAPGVLGNDSDDDGDSLQAVLATAPANGQVTLNADGSFTYLPATGFNGTDRFIYRVSDGVASANATVTLTVQNNTVPTPPDRIAPSVAFTSPRNGARLARFIEISGIARDNAGGSGIEKVVVFLKRGRDGKYWNGHRWSTPTGLDTTLSGPLSQRNFTLQTSLPTGNDLQAGVYYLSAVAFDGAGNRGQQTICCHLLDLTAPVVTITVPHQGATLTRLTQVAGTLTDEASGSGPALVLLTIRRSRDGFYWNGVRWMRGQNALRTTRRGNGNRVVWLATTTLPSAPSIGRDVYYISAFGYDRSGNRDVATIAVTMDNSPSSHVQVSRTALSTAAANATTQRVILKFDGALNANTLKPAHFTVRASGVPVDIESVVYNAATTTITLLLAEGSLQAGDSVDILWSGLLDTQGGVVRGQVNETAR